MSTVDASPDAIRTYGEHATVIAGDLAEAGAFDLAANMAAMTPVFGVVGADFLAAFAVAQANHAASYAELAAHFAATASTAHANAAAYEHTDDASATALRATGRGLGA